MNSNLPDPKSSPQLFENILLQRCLAFIIDSIIIFVIIFLITLALFIAGLLTFGLTWLIIPILLPFAVLAYYASTLGSVERATIGMRIFDIVLVPTKGRPRDGWRILIHPIVFWLTIWAFAPLLLIGLFTSRRQLIHDFLTSTMVVRKSAMGIRS